jgi:hypothetical protein
MRYDERLLAEDLFVYLIYLWQSGEILRDGVLPWLSYGKYMLDA